MRWRPFILLALTFVMLAVGYHVAFDVTVGYPYTTFLGVPATRPYLPDSELYEWLYSAPRLDVTRVLDDASSHSNPNIYGISAIAFFLRTLSVDPLIFNCLLVIGTGLTLLGIAKDLGCSPNGALVVLFCNPQTNYYSQTITKEIPLLFLATLFLRFCNLTKGWLLLLPLVAATALIRVQSGLAMVGLVMLFFLLPRRLLLPASRTGLVLLCVTIPLFYDAPGFRGDTATEFFRESRASALGLGAFIDEGMRNYPMFGFIGIPIRALQNAVEPFPTTIWPDWPSFNLYAVVLLGSCALWTIYAFEFFRLGTALLLNRISLPEPALRVFVGAGVFWLLAAVNPWVHTRFLFYVIPAIVLSTSAVHSSGVWVRGSTLRYKALSVTPWALMMISYLVLFVVTLTTT